MFGSVFARRSPIAPYSNPSRYLVIYPLDCEESPKSLSVRSSAPAELTAEYRRQTNLRGYTISRWHKRSGRANHRLDCLVYALAALSLSRLKIDDCALQRVEARNVGKSEQTKDPARSPFGARKMLVKSDLDIGGLTGFGVELPPDHPQPAGWGALPGSGVSF
jgi:phage terminase large subunit GpA